MYSTNIVYFDFYQRNQATEMLYSLLVERKKKYSKLVSPFFVKGKFVCDVLTMFLQKGLRFNIIVWLWT